MVACVIEQHWTIEVTADRFQVDAKTVRKWRDRFLAEGEAGLQDRSSRPHRSPKRTKATLRNKVLRLRRRHRWGADHIAHETGLAASTVQAILNAAGCGRLDRGDRATHTEPVRRYQRERPGELIHVDVKKIGGIPDGGGWRLHGRGNDAYQRPWRCRLPLHPLGHRRPHPARLLRDPPRRTSHHSRRVLAVGRPPGSTLTASTANV